MDIQAQGTTNPQEDAQRIWDQLELEESGKARPPEDTATESFASDESHPADAPADYHNDDTADAQETSDEEETPGEQLLMDKIAGLESMLNQVTERLRNAEGHIGGLGNQLKQQQQVAAQINSRGGDAPSASEIRDAQRSPEAMEALKRDYPEFADAMEAALSERLQALEERIAQQAPVQQPSIGAEDIERLRAEMAVEIRHPGWQDRVRTTEFVGWLQRQPREVQMLAASESPQDAVRLLDLHDEATRSATSQRTQRLSSAAAIPTGRSGSNARVKPVEDMTPEEYWRYLDELDRQKGN